MKNFNHLLPLAIILLISGIFALCIASADITITDDEGNSVSLQSTASRIVTTNTDCAEMLAVLGAADKIVGVSKYVANDTVLMSILPSTVENIGDWQTPDIEKITEMKPDLIISYSSSKPKNLDQINALGIPIAYLDCYKGESLINDARALGVLTGTESAAEKYTDWVTRWTTVVTSNVSSVSNSPTVYMEGYSDYSAQGTGSGGDDLLTIVKGKNIAASSQEQWPKVSAEWVISENPEYIIKQMSSTSSKSLTELVSSMKTRDGFSTIAAVQNGKVYAINGEAMMSPKYPVGLIAVAKILHPDECKAISPEESLTEYSRFISGYADMQIISPAT